MLKGLFILGERHFKKIYGPAEQADIRKLVDIYAPLQGKESIRREPEMIAVLQKRPDLQAVLDVTHPEPPLPDSPLFTLPNVVLTPHIAGSMDNECRRMGRLMVDELGRYLSGQDLLHGISREKAQFMA